jgi:hypothetical protein
MADAEKRKIGPFTLEDKLGVGGMGIVYRATYIKTGQQVALKALAPDLTADHKVSKRFEREMEILQKLRHPNIIRYYGGVSSGAQQFYAMELLTGGSLDDVLKKRKRLDWKETVDYTVQIAKALEHAHNAGVIHRDLKPGNLMLSEKGVLKLTDFGIARDNAATQLTQAGKTVGTMAYMAPEQITGKTDITRKTDLYALGCVMFQMLTGRTPFESETQGEMLFKHLDESPPSVREYNINVPLQIDEFIYELLSKDPNDRPYDALSVQTRLEEIKTKVLADEAKRAAGATMVDAGGAATAQATQTTGKKKRKKKRKDGVEVEIPFWEKTWFLGACLGLFVAVVAWALMPKSALKLLADARPYMENTDQTQWIHAEKPLEELLKRYPQSTEGQQAREWKDQLEMYQKERVIEARIRRNADPESEGERLYVSALQFEKFGDRASALEKYEAMSTLLTDTPENRPLLSLARRQAQKIKESAGGKSDRVAFVTEQLEKADEDYLAGQTVNAREKWRSIVELYRGNEELRSLVTRASDRLLEPEAAIKKDRM